MSELFEKQIKRPDVPGYFGVGVASGAVRRVIRVDKIICRTKLSGPFARMALESNLLLHNEEYC